MREDPFFGLERTTSAGTCTHLADIAGGDVYRPTYLDAPMKVPPCRRAYMMKVMSASGVIGCCWSSIALM
jgi:hypothetical protein